jgi:hypothetical protein
MRYNLLLRIPSKMPLSIMPFRIITFIIMTFSITAKLRHSSYHFYTDYYIFTRMLNVVMVGVMALRIHFKLEHFKSSKLESNIYG